MSQGQLQQTPKAENFREVRDREGKLLARYAPATHTLEFRRRVHGRAITTIIDLSQFHNNSPPLSSA